eukprot:3720809-Pleurochrysis_carterae.AAC.1
MLSSARQRRRVPGPVQCASSSPLHGGDGASFSFVSPLSMLLSSPVGVGADAGAYGPGGGAGFVGGACNIRPGKEVSVKSAWR